VGLGLLEHMVGFVFRGLQHALALLVYASRLPDLVGDDDPHLVDQVEALLLVDENLVQDRNSPPAAQQIFEPVDERYRQGKQARDFVYSKDVADVIGFFLSNPGVSGLFNVGTGEPRTFNDVARATAEALGVELVIEYAEMPEAMRAHYQCLTRAEIAKLRAAGYGKQFTPLEEGVRDYVSNYLMRDNACLSLSSDERTRAFA